MVKNWNDQLIYLSKIAEVESKTAYAAFIGGLKVSLRIFFKQFLVFINILNLKRTQYQANSYKQYREVYYQR